MTTRVFPSADRPAVRAKGTVRPSDRPMVASEMRRASILKPDWEREEETLSVDWDSRSPSAETSEGMLVLEPRGCDVSSETDKKTFEARPTIVALLDVVRKQWCDGLAKEETLESDQRHDLCRKRW